MSTDIKKISSKQRRQCRNRLYKDNMNLSVPKRSPMTDFSMKKVHCFEDVINLLSDPDSFDTIKVILDIENNPIIILLRVINFDENKPEGHNVYCEDMDDDVCHVYTENG